LRDAGAAGLTVIVLGRGSLDWSGFTPLLPEGANPKSSKLAGSQAFGVAGVEAGFDGALAGGGVSWQRVRGGPKSPARCCGGRAATAEAARGKQKAIRTNAMIGVCD
jgi:hypothetical protein